MKPRKQPRQERSKVTVTAILETTAHILIDEGYESMNTNRVAEKAGVSIGSLYQYFPDKKSLVAALRQRHAEQMKDCLQAALKTVNLSSLEGTVSAMVHAAFEAHLLEPKLHKVLHSEVPEPVLYDQETTLEEDFRNMVLSLLRKRQDQVRPMDFELASKILINIVESLVHAAIIDNKLKEDVYKIEKEAVTLVTRYLKK